MSEKIGNFKELKAGDRHYKAYVGPPLKYDLVGAMQFNLLTAFGLRDHHKLLDIGCGSLRAGKLFISFLRGKNYYGIEPNRWLIDEGIEHEIGKDMIGIKEPNFSYSENFDLSSLDQNFDFINAQSIFSHASIGQISKCLKEVKAVLNSDGLFLATFVLGNTNYEKDDWVYPGCVTYRHDYIEDMTKKENLECIKTKWLHPNGQTWYVIFHPENRKNVNDRVNNLFVVNRRKTNIKQILSKYKIFNNSLTRSIYHIIKGS